jgi:hypothetical protein
MAALTVISLCSDVGLPCEHRQVTHGALLPWQRHNHERRHPAIPASRATTPFDKEKGRDERETYH